MAEKQSQLQLQMQMEEEEQQQHAPSGYVKGLDGAIRETGKAKTWQDFGKEPPKAGPDLYEKPAPATGDHPFLSGLTPNAIDHLPVVNSAFDNSEFGSQFSELKKRMGPEQLKKWMDDVQMLPPADQKALMLEVVKPKFQRETEHNQADRAAAQKKNPSAYTLGQMATGIPLAIGAGAIAGPSIAGQGLAGMATGLAQNGDARSALLGGATGAGMGLIGKGITAPMRGSAEAASAPGAGDSLIATGLGYKSADMTAMTAADDYYARIAELAKNGVPEDEAMDLLKKIGIMPPEGPGLSDVADVARAHSKFPYSAQASKNSIQLPAIARGSRGTDVTPLGEPPVSHIDAEMSQMPTAQLRPPPHPSSWREGGLRPAEINFGPEPAGPHGDIESLLSQANGAGQEGNFSPVDMWSKASTQDLNNMIPSGAKASRNPWPQGQPRPQPQPQNVKLDMLQPEPPPLSPVERDVSQRLGNTSDMGRGLVNDQGLQQTTFPGALRNAAMKRGPFAAGVAGPAKAQRMLEMLNSSKAQAAGGAVEGSGGRLESLIMSVQNSAEPDMIDYLYKEMYPEYNLLSLAAEKKHE